MISVKLQKFLKKLEVQMSLKSMTKFALALIVVLLIGCRGSESKKPPIHIVPNMDLQEKYKAQESSTFFADGGTLRAPVEGTIPHSDMYLRNGADFLKADKEFYDGLTASGTYVTAIPDLKKLGFDNEKELLFRGQKRYEIYCTPCHSSNGDAKGPVTDFARGEGNGFPNVVSFIDKAYVAGGKPVGKIYEVIKNGSGRMPSYAYQVKVRDRWAIVAYIKVLQEAAQKVAQEKNNK
jgi:mono/diheme cytochrome c family protein